ncbi:MAG: hypothetical protein QG603_505 [Patescibacteria group bacterium]|nr:hypothetical protein [Patescibacteria group bacterium]MDQ5970728.1 hypothetical protein [Patescibacteria group bacterium]
MLGSTLGNRSVNGIAGSSYVKFSHVAQEKLHMRPQEALEYVEGRGHKKIPELGRNLRWFGSTHDVDNLEVHHEDADEFIKRVKKHLAEEEAKAEQNKNK